MTRVRAEVQIQQKLSNPRAFDCKMGALQLHEVGVLSRDYASRVGSAVHDTPPRRQILPPTPGSRLKVFLVLINMSEMAGFV